MIVIIIISNFQAIMSPCNLRSGLILSQFGHIHILGVEFSYLQIYLFLWTEINSTSHIHLKNSSVTSYAWRIELVYEFVNGSQSYESQVGIECVEKMGVYSMCIWISPDNGLK